LDGAFLLLLLPVPRTEILFLGIPDLHGSDRIGMVFTNKGKNAVPTLEKMGRYSEFFGIAQLTQTKVNRIALDFGEEA
jgi:hypothetical protein